jgi:geranylgeranyl reductase family protein
MKQNEAIDVLIVGSGPAGMSTALHLLQNEAGWAERVVVVDKAVHPREKLCGGGITQLGEQALAALGLAFEPQSFPVYEVRLTYQDQVYALRDNPLFRVVRRDEFDHWLVRQGEKQGVRVRQNEAVVDITVRSDHVEVVTSRSVLQAKAIVAADGSRSIVRRKLKWAVNGRLARLLEVLTPEVADQQLEFRENVAVLDFSSMKDGLQGYVWDFPSFVNGQPWMNRGIFDSRTRPERPRAGLKQELRGTMSKRGRDLEQYELKGHPIFWFDKKARFARPRVLLVGDAAGVDPLLGEGISFALGYGEVAAAALVDAFDRQDFSFSDYNERVLAHPILSQLRIRAFVANQVYRIKSPLILSLCWRLTPLFTRLLTWYNSR